MKLYFGTFPKNSLKANMLQPIFAKDAGEASNLMTEYHGKYYNVIITDTQYELAKEERYADHKHYEIIMSAGAEMTI